MPDPNLVVTLVMSPPWRLAQLAAVVVFAGAWLWAWRADYRVRPVHPDVAAAWLLWHYFTGGTLEVGRSFAPELGWLRYLARRAGVAVARTAAAAGLVLVEYLRSGGAITQLGELVRVGLVGTALAAAWLLASAVVAAEGTHYLRFVRPLALALGPVVKWERPAWPQQQQPGQQQGKRRRRRIAYLWLVVPRGLAAGRSRRRMVAEWVRRRIGYDPPKGDHGVGVKVKLPPTFKIAGTSVQDVIDTTLPVLDLRNVVATPVHRGRRNWVQFLPAEVMPAAVRLGDPEVVAALASHRFGRYVVGLTVGGRVVWVDLDVESPHVLLSAGTGAGKSALIRALLLQLMAEGAQVVVVDVKRHSQPWLNSFPGVVYARDVPVIHDVLCGLGAEGHRRNSLYDGLTIDDPQPTPPRRLVVVCEEMNATMALLQSYWRDIRPPGAYRTSPAVMALRELLFMGRAVRIHVFGVAQMATAKDLGGPEARENFAIRLLARHTDRAWRMLVPEIPFRAASRHPGRWYSCIAGEATNVQALYPTPWEARDYVLEHRVIDDSPALDVASVAAGRTPGHQGEQPATVAATYDRPRDAAELALPLRELAPLVGMEYHGLRQAILRATKQGDPLAPPNLAEVVAAGVAGLYRLTDVKRMLDNRPRGVGRETTDIHGGNESTEGGRMELTHDG